MNPREHFAQAVRQTLGSLLGQAICAGGITRELAAGTVVGVAVGCAKDLGENAVHLAALALVYACDGSAARVGAAIVRALHEHGQVTRQQAHVDAIDARVERAVQAAGGLSRGGVS